MVLAAATLLLLAAGRSGAQGNPAVNPVTFHPGTIVDAGRGFAYVMSEKGGVDKVDLATGKAIWHSNDAAKPLTLGPAGEHLVVQVQPAKGSNQLAFASIDAADGRAMKKPDGSKLEAAISLPAGVKASVIDTPSGHFSANARVVNGKAVVTWKSSGQPRRGLPPGVEEKLQPERREASKSLAAPQVGGRSGAFVMDLASGDVSALNAPEVLAPTAALGPGAGGGSGEKWQPVEVSGSDRIPQFMGPQFYSEDKRHILVQEQGPDDEGVYKLAVYNRASREREGRLTTHRPAVPFVVTKDGVVFESTPALIGGQRRPPLIQAVDKDGKTLWSYAIRNIHLETSPP